MRKLIFLLLLLLIATPVFAQQQEARMSLGVVGGSVPAVAGGIACTGSENFAAGATEDFEKAEDDTCTDAWTISDTDGHISTYSTGAAHCGTHSLALSQSATNATVDYVSYNINRTTNAVYVRFYFIPANQAAWSNACSFFYIGNSVAGLPNFNIRVALKNFDVGLAIYFAGDSGVTTDYFPVVAGTKYRLEIYTLVSGTATVKLYNGTTGAAVNCVGTTECSGNTLSDPATAYQPNYIVFVDCIGTAGTHYIDDAKYSGTGALGVETCP